MSQHASPWFYSVLDPLCCLDLVDCFIFHVRKVFNYQFSSVTQSCLILCDPMDCSVPGSPVHGILVLQRAWLTTWNYHVTICYSVQFSSVLSRVRLFATQWIAARQASLSITNSRSLLNLMSIMSVMPSNHLILCCPLLLLPSIFPSIRVFSNESVLHLRWPEY